MYINTDLMNEEQKCWLNFTLLKGLDLLNDEHKEKFQEIIDSLESNKPVSGQVQTFEDLNNAFHDLFTGITDLLQQMQPSAPPN